MSSFCKSCAQSIPNNNFFLHNSTCIPVFEKCKKCNTELLKSELEDHLYAHSLHEEEEKQQNPQNQLASQQIINQNKMIASNNNIIPNNNGKSNFKIDDSPNKLQILSNKVLSQKRSELFSDIDNGQCNKLNDRSPLMFNPFRDMSFQDNNLFECRDKSSLSSNNCINQKKEMNKEIPKFVPKKLENKDEEVFMFGNKTKYNNGFNMKSNSIFDDPDIFKESTITNYNPPRKYMTDIFKVEKVNPNKSVCEDSYPIYCKKGIFNNQVKNIQPNPVNKEVKPLINNVNKFKNKKNFYSTEDHVYTKIDPKLIPLIPESSITNTLSLNETECSICLDDFKIKDKILTIPCSHYFHSKCIKEWLMEKDNTCPSCKFILDKNTIQ